ncbi:protein YgfX [Chitinibacter sp. FCG-7]|uniref:Protein YgfX n=1 Tax=Chitinibacter mangrovi TaxID=3153927 RepID=A0AAU7F937_9NEIS
MLPAVLQINPASKWQRGFLCLTHALALLNAWWLAWPWALMLSALLLLSLRFYWLKAQVVNQIQCLPDGLLDVHTRAGQRYSMQLLASSVLTAHVLVLHLRGDGQKFQVVIWPDSAPAEVLRQWRVYLRWIWPNLHRK